MAYAAAAHEAPSTEYSTRWALAKWAAYIALVDLLFLPYFQWIILPCSLPLVILAWAALRGQIRADAYLVLFVVIALAVLISSGWSIFLPGASEYLVENVKRALQLLSTFLYFFYFRWVATRVRLRLTPIFVLFVLWFSALAFVFVARPLETTELLRLIYGRLVASEDIVSEHLRFPYLFTDANTAAYFFLVATAPLLLRRPPARWFAPIVLVMTTVTLLTQSRGAILALVLMLLATIYPPERLLSSILSVRRMLALVLIATAIAAVGMYVVETMLDSSQIVDIAYRRLFESKDLASGGTRFENWAHIAGHIPPLPLGRGFMLFIDGNLEYPHSDLLRFLYSYGWIALIPALMFFFRHSISLAPLILPALAAFLINTLIDEQKLLGLFLSLLAIYIGSEERRRRAAARGPAGSRP